MRLWLKASCLSALALGAGAVALGADRPSGYLSPGEFDVTHVIEPAPRKGDPRYETDRKIFKATRALVGTPRWQLATSDAEINARALLRDFSCSVGVALTPENAPQVANVIARATRDTGAQTSRAKEFYQRNRP